MNKIDDIHVALAQKGFVIFKKNESWIMKKIAMPGDDRVMEDTPFLTYDGALQEATRLLHTPANSIKWMVLMRYNRGLGAENRTLDCVDAPTHNEAQEKAKQAAEEFCRKAPDMVKAKIIEIRTMPITTQAG